MAPWHRARLAPDVEGLAIAPVMHDDLGSVARETARRFRGNVRTVLQHRLAGRVVVRTALSTRESAL